MLLIKILSKWPEKQTSTQTVSKSMPMNQMKTIYRGSEKMLGQRGLMFQEDKSKESP